MLDAVLGRLARQHDPNVLVGFDKADDAGVYRLDDRTALVQTVDFFTPIVDDPYTFGQIAAVNALSDVYAMGGRPLSSLALVCFPEKQDLAILEQILAGGLSKMMEARCVVIGGHSIRDPEIKFGYAVTGLIDPQKVRTNAAAQVGDLLVLTKPLGTGVISTALKRGSAFEDSVAAATRSMTTLNQRAAELASGFAIHGMTDVTGFGLIGHARELAVASGVSLRLDAHKVPLLAGALDCIRGGNVPGGLQSNRDFAECAVGYVGNLDAELKAVLFDPQTAGGLLISVAAADAEKMTAAMCAEAIPAAIIGEVVPSRKPLISVE